MASGSKVMEKIMSEFHELLKDNKPIPEDIWRTVPLNLFACIEEKNPNYAYIALILCNSHGFTPTKTMCEVFAQAATWQLNDEGRGTIGKIKRSEQKSFHMLCIAHLLAVGNTVEQACRKTAILSYMKYPMEKTPFKASTLEIEHRPSKHPFPSLDEDVKRMHEKVWDPKEMPLPDGVQAGELVHPELSAKWKVCSDSLPECPENLIGNTRE